MGRFDDRATRPSRGVRHMLRWKLDQLRGRVPDDPDPEYAPARRENDGSALRSLPASLTWIGHASMFLRLGGRFVAIDPVWSPTLSGVVRRQSPPGLPLEAVPAPDLVLCTHNHRDHLDPPTLARIGPKATCVVPLGNAPLLRRAGCENIVELDWWQSHREGDLEVTLVPARHWSMWHPWNRNDMLWGGYVLRAPEGVAYHSGDTALFDGFAEIGRRLGPIDWAMLPIGAYAPRWFMQPQHAAPEESGEAFEQLGARVFVAMHWGTFRLTDEPLREPVERIERWWGERGKPREALWVLDLGETRALAPAGGLG